MGFAVDNGGVTSREVEAMRLTVHVSPGSRTPLIGGRYGDAEPPVLIVRVTAPAIDGKANAATVDAVAGALGLPRRSVRIVSGHGSRTKILDASGADPDVLAALLGG
jgi:uncharacterized protein YggU (UPF0235/DUF167 family)